MADDDPVTALTPVQAVATLVALVLVLLFWKARRAC
jgi:hypothetical protein